MIVISLFSLCTAIVIFSIILFSGKWTEEDPETSISTNLPQSKDQITAQKARHDALPSWIIKDLIPINGSGRCGEPLEDLTAIVIHYVGNPGTTARQNHNYFSQPDTTVSSHFLVGLDGEILQCLPLSEKSSATNHRNRDTISIEVCHPDETGVFTDESYDALVKLTVWLCDTFDFSADQIIRHYDVTGKICPKQFVEDESAWLQFLSDIEAALSAI